MAIHTRSNKQSANAEVHSTNNEILIPVSTNIQIVLSASSPVLSKTPTKTQIPSTHMTYIQHQLDALRIPRRIPKQEEYQQNLCKYLLKFHHQ